MISSEKARAYIQQHKKINITTNDLKRFSEPYRNLGLILMHKQELATYQQYFDTEKGSNPWNNEEGLQLANLLYGRYIGPYISKIWDFMDDLPYQIGYSRRPFRIKSVTFPHAKLEGLKQIYYGNSSGFNMMSFEEQLQYDVYQNVSNIGLYYAVVLAEDPKRYQEFFEEVILGEHEIAGVSSELVRALLLTNVDAYHLLVEKLLLAAQQQEGLRQTILETLDFTSLQALKRFMQIILQHDLIRFSAVIRAVDTWFGFGWDAPKNSTIKRVLELALGFMETPDKIVDGLRSRDNLEVYVALWVKALTDVDVANELAFSQVFDEKTDTIKKMICLFFINQTERTDTDIIQYASDHFGSDVELDYWLMVNFPSFEISDLLFSKMIATASRLPTAGQKFIARGFSWKNHTIRPEDFYNSIINNAQPHHFLKLAEDLSQVPSTSRENLMRKLFPKHYTYSWSFRYGDQKQPEVLDFEEDSWQRKVARQALSDRNSSVSATGITIFQSMNLYPADIDQIEAMLTRKGKDLRKVSIELLLKQRDEVLKACMQRLIASANIDQRLAALEMLTLVSERTGWQEFVMPVVEQYKTRKLNKNEQIFLDKLSPETVAPKYGFLNGFGAIDYSNVTAFRVPEERFPRSVEQKKSLFEKTSVAITKLFNKASGETASLISAELIDIEKTTKATNELIALFDQHKDYEYQYEGYQGSLETILLSDGIYGLRKLEQDATPVQHLENLPLADIWIKWYREAGLNDFELHAVARDIPSRYYDEALHAELKKFRSNYIPSFPRLQLDESSYYYYSRSAKVVSIIENLNDAYTDKEVWSSYKLDVLEDALHFFPEELKKENFKNPTYYSSQDIWWTDVIYNLVYNIDKSDYDYLDQEQLFRLYQLQLYMVGQQIMQEQSVSNIQDIIAALGAILSHARKQIKAPCRELIFRLYSLNKLNDDDLLFLSLIDKDLFFILDGGQNYLSQQLKHHRIPCINTLLKENLLKVELERGDMPTEASSYIGKMQQISGVHYFFEVLQRIGNEKFDRGYSYGTNVAKKYTFSHILKNSVAAPDEDYTLFTVFLKNASLDKKRLIEISCYATQWADWVGDYLSISKLREAVWWFLAHTTDYMDAEKETIIARYSKIPRNDFKNGAIDIDWFHEVYKNIGKSNWKLIHESAKYLSDGLGYRRVKIYSSVLLGETKITETLKKISEKRDKDYVMALGLIPISKANPEADLLKRYHLLQTFLKESKQFGTQRQESERNAVEIGLDNLARNAGYDDSVRFIWAMEGKATQQILKDAYLKIDDLELQLLIDEEGKTELSILKNGKSLKKIPEKYKKNTAIDRLKEGKSYLTKQYTRTKQALENSMLRRDEYSVHELEQIMAHPIVRAMMSKLVLVNSTDQNTGFWTEKGLITIAGKIVDFNKDDRFLIAHSVHLFQNVEWDLYQRYLFENAVQQPFKQVFRELYIPTPDELEQSYRSSRYQGHQVQPQKAVALLRGRGWTVSNEEGLQKVFHKEGYMVTLFAQADWYTPADIESPTLEYVCFYSLKDHKVLPVKTIDPVLFSEVMRDLDLVVSIAHVGEVDPEASHSSMQMRAVLARESAHLFKLDNVEVKERYILIKGQLADYAIHLGSGMVSKNGMQISIIPVHSQHRGRVFLPFVDDDPKSAEIISKMRYLAQDNQIKDPTILAQINS